MTLAERAGWMLLAVALLALTANGEATSKRERSRPFAVGVHVVDFEKKGQEHRRSRHGSFDGYETHTIEFDVFSRGRFDLERPTRIKVYLPNGDLYSAIDLEALGSNEGETRRRRRPMPAATARMRVSGTVITRYGLYGEWSAEVCWETGSVTSCERALTFEIH